MTRRELRKAGLPASVVLAFLSACEGPPARSKPWRHEEPAAPVPRSALLAEEEQQRARRGARDRDLRIHIDADPRHLNPMVAPTVWTQRIAADAIFETLLRLRPPEGAAAGPGRYLPGLARSFTVHPGGREIRVELRRDVRFHDGRRMTSVDVQFSLDAARHPRTGATHLRGHLQDVAGVDLAGPGAVRIRLSRQNGYVLRALAEVPILPQHVYDRAIKAAPGPAIGTGPYRLAASTEAEIRLERFADYWGSAPVFESVAFVRGDDAARALTAAAAGELDLIPALIPAHYPEQATTPGIAAAFAPLRLAPPRFRYLVLNARRPPFDAVEVRRAVSLLVPRAELARATHRGLARPVAGPIWPGGPGHGPAADPPPADPAAAAALLDQAGWRDGEGRGARALEGRGRRLLVTVLATEEESAERQAVIAALERSGFVVDLRVGTPAVLQKRLRDGAFDLAFLEWEGAVDRDLSPLFETGGAQNFGGFSDERVDRLLARVRGTFEPAERARLLAELAPLLAELAPVAPLVAPDPYGLVHKRIHGAIPWDGWISLRDLTLAE